ncbi:MAG: DNA helicase II [Alphaproteobacteria bacterium]|nr:DNA helicase II [Alphaproteobacteria bacterium]
MSDPFDLVAAGPRTPAAPPPAPLVRPPAADFLAGLNQAQAEAVAATEGAVLVLAGAGTGKTRVLTHRLAHILTTGRAWPSQILAVTFTNKAAREMGERVGRLIGQAVEGLWLGTFHAIGARILRRHAELVGLTPTFTILDADDQVRLLKQILRAENLDDKRWPARALAGIISRWKDRGLTPDKVTPAEDSDFALGKARALYATYQARLKTLNAADFGDLLLLNLTLFAAHPDVLADYQRRFRYLLVDEYQDTNVAQYLWLRLLAQGHRNICCVGDDDQSIYGWRGAEVGNILRFETDFTGARIVRLERNYRSTQPILSAASGLIAHNAGRLGKTLWTDAPGGEPVTLQAVLDGDQEARTIIDEVEALQARGQSLADIAVLVRAGFQTRAFEERLIQLGIAYRVVGGPRFYERQEIRDAIAYVRVLHQPDDDLAFERIVNLPKRGIGDSTLLLLHGLARARGLSLTRSVTLAVETDELPPKARAALLALRADFERWRGQLGSLPHAQVIETLLDESGYTGLWRAAKTADAPGRLENLRELVQAIAEFETIGAFLEHVALVMENAESGNQPKLSVMTLHSAKGLEFDVVFLPGWEEGLFPHPLALDEQGTAGLEEERRLAYVGITRAKREVHITCAASRLVHNQWRHNIPSRFIAELPVQHVLRRDSATPSPGGFRYRQSAADAYVAAFAGQGAPRAAAPGARTPPASPQGFRAGERVRHARFGDGLVVAVDGNKLDIAFTGGGIKKVIDSFVERA